MKLWSAIVGSHMWGMDHENSDIDIYEIHILEPIDILLGKKADKGKHIQKNHIDIQQYYLKHLLTQLQKGNINFIWAITSPYIVYHNDFGKRLHQDICEIFVKNLSLNLQHSVLGMSNSNLQKYTGFRLNKTNGKIYGDKPSNFIISLRKKIRTIGRTVKFAENLLRGRVKFEPCYITTINELEEITTSFVDSLCALQDDLPEKTPKDIYKYLLASARLCLIEQYGRLVDKHR